MNPISVYGKQLSEQHMLVSAADAEGRAVTRRLLEDLICAHRRVKKLQIYRPACEELKPTVFLPLHECIVMS